MTSALILLLSACKNQKEDNPLLSEFHTPYQTPPFDRIQIAHYEPAFDKAIAEAQKEITDIAASTQEPGFENTIAALDQAGEQLNTISSVFFNLNSACTNEEMQQIAQRISPKLTEYSNNIYMNPGLFQRVKQVYDHKNNLRLTPEQTTLLQDTWKAFVKGGANLTGKARKRFQEITMELARLSLKFEENILAETNEYSLHITDKQQNTQHFICSLGALKEHWKWPHKTQRKKDWKAGSLHFMPQVISHL